MGAGLAAVSSTACDSNGSYLCDVGPLEGVDLGVELGEQQQVRIRSRRVGWGGNSRP